MHVVNGRKTVEEAAWDATHTVGLAGLAGGAAAGVLTAASGLGLTISAPVAIPLAVVGGGAYLWVSGERVLGALDDETREAAEAQLASVQSGIEERVQPIRDGASAVIASAQEQAERGHRLRRNGPSPPSRRMNQSVRPCLKARGYQATRTARTVVEFRTIANPGGLVPDLAPGQETWKGQPVR